MKGFSCWLRSWFDPAPASTNVSPHASLKQEMTREVVTLHARVLLHMPLVQLFFIVGVGWIVYWLFLIRVATESERLLHRSVLIRQERDRIIATVSHDLRQPLHALSLHGAILVSHPSEQTLRETRRNIDHVVQDLEKMLTDLLDLSKISTGNFPTQAQFFSLDTAIAHICAEFDSIASEKGLVIRRTLDPVRISGDKLAVARIARNLIDNAIKFTDQGEIHVTTSPRQDGGALLSVTDTGKGISATDRELIFREFYQAAPSEGDQNQGVGLGLSIVHRLSKLMDAELSLKSAPGQGSCFQVWFPPNRGIVAPKIHR